MRAGLEQLRAFFEPSSIAVVGASASPGKVGYNVLFNLAEAPTTAMEEGSKKALSCSSPARMLVR